MLALKRKGLADYRVASGLIDTHPDIAASRFYYAAFHLMAEVVVKSSPGMNHAVDPKRPLPFSHRDVPRKFFSISAYRSYGSANTHVDKLRELRELSDYHPFDSVEPRMLRKVLERLSGIFQMVGVPAGELITWTPPASAKSTSQ